MIFLVKIKLDYIETAPLPIPSIKFSLLKLSCATCLRGNRFTVDNPAWTPEKKQQNHNQSWIIIKKKTALIT